MMVSPGDNIQNDFLAQQSTKFAVLQDQLSVLQDLETWTPL